MSRIFLLLADTFWGHSQTVSAEAWCTVGKIELTSVTAELPMLLCMEEGTFKHVHDLYSFSPVLTNVIDTFYMYVHNYLLIILALNILFFEVNNIFSA